MEVSVVVPVFNEQENLATLHKEIFDVLEKEYSSFEIIFVNDGSTDQTENVLETLSPITVLTLKKNCGQTAAIAAGLRVTRFSTIALLDGDGQNDPRDIVKLQRKLEEEKWDAVCGWRIDRKDKFTKKVISRGANILRAKLAPDNIHDSGCTLKVMTKQAAASLELRGELHRFISSILVMRGFKICELPVNHRARQFGVTKYNWRRVGKGYLDMLMLWFWNRYSQRPFHFFGAASGLLFATGLVLLFTSIYSHFFLESVFKDFMLLSSISCFLFSGQTLLIGILAEYLSGIRSTDANRYFVESSLLVKE